MNWSHREIQVTMAKRWTSGQWNRSHKETWTLCLCLALSQLQMGESGGLDTTLLSAKPLGWRGLTSPSRGEDAYAGQWEAPQTRN